MTVRIYEYEFKYKFEFEPEFECELVYEYHCVYEFTDESEWSENMNMCTSSSYMLALSGQAMLKINTTGRVCRKPMPEDGADRVVTYLFAQT